MRLKLCTNLWPFSPFFKCFSTSLVLVIPPHLFLVSWHWVSLMNSLILVGETHILDALLSCCWTKKYLPRCFCLFTFSSLAMSFPASCRRDPRKIPYTEVCQVDMGITFRNVSHLKFPRPMGFTMLQMHCLILYMYIYIYLSLSLFFGGSKSPSAMPGGPPPGVAPAPSRTSCTSWRRPRGCNRGSSTSCARRRG